MRHSKQRLAALFTAAVMAITLGAPVSAEFVDPAVVYSDYVNGKQTSTDYTSSDSNSEDSEAADSEIVGELPEDEEEKVASSSAEEESGSQKTEPDDNDNTPSASESSEKVKKPATEVTIYSYKASVEVGDSFKIGYRLKPASSDDKVTYSTSNSKVASIDKSGTVTANKKGSAIITVRTGSGVRDRFTVTVREAEAIDDGTENDSASSADSSANNMSSSDSSSGSTKKIKPQTIEIKNSSVTIYSGETHQIRYEFYPKNAESTVKFRSRNKAVASVDSDGVITAKGEGTTQIICTAENGVSEKINLTVLPLMSQEEQDELIEQDITLEYNEKGQLVPSEVRFGSESASVQIGEKVSLDARVYPAGATYKYTIKSDNPSVAKVNSRGEVTGLKAGNAVITLTTDNGKTDSIYVTVYGDVIRGIDVSKWNGDIDWKAVKRSGEAQFVMIRASYGYEDTDPKLAENVAGCEKYDIPYGFYHYMYAKNVSEAKKEAAYFLNAIEQYSPKYPVVLDIEEDFYKQMSKKEVTSIVTTFMEALENAGYYAMIYSYSKFFDDNLIMDKIEKYDIWVACWGDEDKLAENYSYHYGMWQYSETGRIAGIDEDVDLNFAYKDYRATIEKYGLNQ